MTDIKFTHEDLQAVKKYVAYRFFCTCAVNIVILANCIRFIVDRYTYESIKMVIRVITYGSMAGVFMWSASARGQGDIDKKLSELKNSPQGVRLKQRFTSSNIIGFVAIGIGLIALYLMLQGIGNELILRWIFLLSVVLELIASVFLCKKAMNSIDRMDI